MNYIVLYKTLKCIFYNIHQPVIITSSPVIAITVHEGRPERNNAFIWLQKIHKVILNEMATFRLAKSDRYGREDSIRSSFNFIYKILNYLVGASRPDIISQFYSIRSSLV